MKNPDAPLLVLYCWSQTFEIPYKIRSKRKILVNPDNNPVHLVNPVINNLIRLERL